jgi:hypothetical protein
MSLGLGVVVGLLLAILVLVAVRGPDAVAQPEAGSRSTAAEAGIIEGRHPARSRSIPARLGAIQRTLDRIEQRLRFR